VPFASKVDRVTRVLLSLTALCGLAALLLWSWANRFAAESGAYTLAGEDLPLVLDAADGPRSHTFVPPGDFDSPWLFTRFRVVADGLEGGAEKWQTGRMFVRWIVRDGGDTKVSGLHSAAGDHDSGMMTLAVRRPADRAIPRIQIENLGVSGTYRVDFLEVTATTQRLHWKVLRALIPLGFALALAALIFAPGRAPLRRVLAAAAVWVVAAMFYSIPGPWEGVRPLAMPLQMAASGTIAESPGRSLIPAGPGPAESEEMTMGRLPDPDHIGLKIKTYLPFLRQLLHVLVLFAPTLLIAIFVDARRALALGLALSFSIEGAQFLYGFGFGLDDADDLVFNTIGILAALWLRFRLLPRLWRRGGNPDWISR